MWPVVAVGAVCGVQGVVGNALCATEQSTPSVSRAFSTAPGVPGMLDSLEVQVLCPGLVETKG